MGKIKEDHDLMVDDDRDSKLVERWQESKKESIRDIEAINRLYMNHREKLLHFFMSRTKSVDIAEELLTETFIQVYKCLDKYKPLKAFRFWLFTIAQNLLRDHYRQLRLFQEEKETFKNPEEYTTDFEKESEKKALYECLDYLNEEEYKVIYSRYFGDKTLKAIGGEFDISKQAVAQRIKRVEEKLSLCINSKI